MTKSYSYPTQIAWACHALLSGREICQQDQLREVGGWRLPAIVFQLRCGYGWNIKTYIDDNKIAHYRLEATCKPADFKIPPSFNFVKEC